jgi:hypothetical protein
MNRENQRQFLHKRIKIFAVLNGVNTNERRRWTLTAGLQWRVRPSADPLNIRPGAPRLDMRRYFYSQRVVDSWNSVPHAIKNSVYVTAFKNAYRRHRDAPA